MSAEDLAEGRHHRGHDPAVDRPRGPRGPDRGPVARAVRGGQGEAVPCGSTVDGRATSTRTPARARSTPAQPAVVFVHGAAQRPQRVGAAVALLRAPRLQRARRRSARPRALGRAPRCHRSRRSPTGSRALLDAAQVDARGAGRPFARARSRRSAARRVSRARRKARAARPRRADAGERRAARRRASRRSRRLRADQRLVAQRAASSSAAIAVPGMWMTGAALRLMERIAPGRAVHRPHRVQRATRTGSTPRAERALSRAASSSAQRDLMAPPKSAQALLRSARGRARR